MKITGLIGTFLLTLLIEMGFGQDNSNFWLRFTDKNNNPYSLSNPEAFLSTEAIERRDQQEILLDRKDLPVTPAYVDSLRSFDSLEVLYTSKWFNAVAVHSTDSLLMDTIDQISFVESKRTVKSYRISGKDKPRTFLSPTMGSNKDRSMENIHGKASGQIEMLGLHQLHQQEGKGQGKTIAVLDAGFPSVWKMKAFEEIFAQGRYKGGYDMVDHDGDPFSGHAHGTSVLSIITGNLEGTYLGAAPRANFLLYRTEDVSSEFIIEEHNWIAAAEKADSAGADILTTSLGYTVFNDSTQDHTTSDMDGNTTMITKGADIAASRGMLIINSAGNTGNSQWGVISAPADGDSVLAVGAVTEEEMISDFSARGPTADGRIKPNVCAQGVGTAFIGLDDTVYFGNGTSFSAPLIAGGAACLWSVYPEMTAQELYKAIENAGDRSSSPDNEYGNGVPDFYKAFLNQQDIDPSDHSSTQLVKVSPNPFRKELRIDLYSKDSETAHFQILDMNGKVVEEWEEELFKDHYHIFKLEKEVNHPRNGVLFLRIMLNNKTFVSKLMRI